MKESRGASIVTQTCVRPDRAEDFARWQGETSTLIARFPGFIEQRLLPPNPPLQQDWVILQRFATVEDARRWLTSPERHRRIDLAGPMLLGRTDVHIIQDDAGAARSSPVSAVIGTRVKSGKEAEYRAWERKIAAAQSKAPGLQGYRFEPAIPGVQEDCVAILRFDSEANMNAWLNSDERRRLVEEAAPLIEGFHSRVAHSGFEQWFRDVPGGGNWPLWKMNMIVLLALYPVVFLWTEHVAFPYLGKMPFAISLFLGNIFSVTVTGFTIPWIANRLGWWLNPRSPVTFMVHFLGAALMVAAYAAMVFAFWRFY